MQASRDADLLWWIEQLNALNSAKKCYSPDFLKPFHFVTTALEVKRRGYKSLKLPENLTSYAVRMNLWEAAGLPDPTSVGQNPEADRFLPVEALRNANAVHESANKLARIAAKHGATQATVNSLEIVLMELLGNCYAHAKMEEELWGLACAQAWPRGHKAQIAIADCGVGVRATLSENAGLLTRLDSENGCEIATEYGVTSKPGMGHAGYGLTLARQLLELNGGSLIIVSHGEYFSSSSGGLSRGAPAFPWHGTVVVLEWNTDRPLDIDSVYKTWPLPEGMTDDDFDF